MDGGLLEPSLYSIKAIAILDNDGNRLLAKYYDDTFPNTKEQRNFEKNVFNKTHRANAEIVMFEGLTCVYKSNVDLFFYVVGSSMENELILSSVLNAFYDSTSQILRKNVEKRALLDNLDAVFLAADELCDGGIILEADSNSIVQKVAIRNDDIPLGEQTMAQITSKYGQQVSAATDRVMYHSFNPVSYQNGQAQSR
ncbi:coatomer subunit zeta-1 [Plakobranchus ocellatus]|uniref:Coatomer subunit zeta n=1 Tax=Plakobranchus ocellatus TaxID=259542 RepID=A0AAV4AW60_9GAST|nr:coatomer subunit zeta-1 [Plakobranchus ocellatus]